VVDMYLHSKIEAKEIKREKGTILQELSMYEDIPMRNVEDVFEKLLYSRNNLGREIVGYKKTIKAFQRKNFLDYMRRFYVANDTVVCVAGKIDEKKVIRQIRKYFAAMKKSAKPKFLEVEENQKQPHLKIKFKKTDQTHLMLGTRAYKQKHKDRYALALLAIILGGNMSSRMFIEVRERRGLAYYVKTDVAAFEDCGYMATNAGVEHRNLKLALKTILQEYTKIARKKVSEKELQKAKDFLKGKAIMNMEASDEVAMFFIEQTIMQKKIMTLKEKFALIDKVNSDDILRVAQDIFQNNKLNLAIVGPHKNFSELKNLLKL